MILLKIIKNLLNYILKRNIRLIGEYKNWKQAKKNSKGYNDRVIFEKTIKSFHKVYSNEALYERDSFLFYKKNYNKFLINILKKIKKKKSSAICLCDFGGSLGSLYFQHKNFFSSFFIDWNIIEQKKYVNYANKFINIKNLNFYSNIEDLFKKKKIDIFLFSSVLQYLESPYKIIEKIIKKKITHILILRTPFLENCEEIKVQKIPKYIYPSSYPVRILNFTKFNNLMKNKKYILQKKIKIIEKLDNYNYFNLYYKK